MLLTDKEAIRLMNRARSADLWEQVESFPEDERDERTDLEVVLDELEYLISMYEEDSTTYSDDLRNAKTILKETENGKVMPVLHDGFDISTFRVKYSDGDIEWARNTVNEYKRLKKLLKEYF